MVSGITVSQRNPGRSYDGGNGGLTNWSTGDAIFTMEALRVQMLSNP